MPRRRRREAAGEISTGTDPLAPLSQAREAIERIRGSALQEHIYLGAHHEILNEINKDEVIEEIIAFVRSCLESERTTQTASIRP